MAELTFWLGSMSANYRALRGRERIRQKAKLYVQNPSFNEALSILRKHNFCIITGIPGIGKKTAERMVLELRDKLPEVSPSTAPAAPTLSATEEDVLSALLNLGYQRAAAEKALTVVAKNGKGGTFDAMFRDALAALSK